MTIEVLVALILAGYFIVGASQIITAVRIKKEANTQRFPKKDIFVSVIIPVKSLFSTTRHNLESVCTQRYPRFEVLFVAEVVEHEAYAVAKGLANRYQNTKVLLSGQHDSARTIGKCHNLVYAAGHAQGEVFLFGDSDVSYSRDWLRAMISPLTEKVNGNRIHAVTAPFFIEPEGFFGKFIALSVSLVMFTASFTHRDQRFPAYVSGASMAVTRDVFHKSKIAKIWAGTFNDDLVLADTLLDGGYNIYNQLAHLNHPNEAFLNLKQTKDKLVRWVVTISTFGHRDLRVRVPGMMAKNLQFQAALILGLALYLVGFSWVVALGIVLAGYCYLVVYRWLVGAIIEERGLLAYYLLAPISVTAMMLFYALVRPFYRSFSWEGKGYTVQGRYSK